MLPEQSLSQGGASLTAAFSLLMSHPTFKAEVLRRMTHEERLRLCSLHQQAIHGDADAETSTQDGGPSTAATTADDSACANGSRGSPPSLPWFDFAGKERRRRWAALRGTMTPQVASETFCAELIAMLEKYPSNAVIPLVEAALTRAQHLQEAAAATTTTTTATATAATVAAAPFSGSGEDERLSFCVRCYDGDPAALALLWICRAFGLPCELTIEPISMALPPADATAVSQRRSVGKKAAAAATDLFYFSAVMSGGGCYAVPLYSGVRRGASFVAEVEGPEASFKILCDTFLSRLPHWQGVRAAGADPRDPAVEGSDTDRASAPADGTAGEAGPPSWRAAQLAADKAAWLDDIVSVTADLRTPILTLIIDGAARERASQATRQAADEEAADGAKRTAVPRSSVALGASTAAQLSAVVAHLLHYQHRFVQKCVQRSRTEAEVARQQQQQQQRGQRRSSGPWDRTQSWSPLAVFSLSVTDAGAAVDVVDRQFLHTQRLVSCVDLYLASCGYTLCTHPFARGVFPASFAHAMSRQGPSAVLGWSGAGSAYTVAPDFAPLPCSPPVGSNDLPAGPGAGESSSATCSDSPRAPAPPPAVCLPGMPRGYNDLINRVLRRQSAAAYTRLGDDNATHVAAGTPAGAAADACVPTNAFAAAEALERYIFAQVVSISENDILVKAGAGSTFASLASASASPSTVGRAATPYELTDAALSPFLPLAHILAGSWTMANRQCVGFPFMLAAGRAPVRRVDFLWERTADAAQDRRALLAGDSPSGSSSLPPLRGVQHVKSSGNFGVDSWETRLRRVGWAVLDAMTSGATSPRRALDLRERECVLHTDGKAEAKL